MVRIVYFTIIVGTMYEFTLSSMILLRTSFRDPRVYVDHVVNELRVKMGSMSLPDKLYTKRFQILCRTGISVLAR